MSVCRFSRPTSCRACLTSAIALSYKTLSGSAVFSALVDLLTFFFLWRNCASHRVALRRNNPVINNSVERFAISMNVDRFTVAKNVDRFTVAKNVDRFTVAKNVDRFTVAKNVDRFAVAKNVDRFAVAKNRVLRKLHLSLANSGFLSAACQTLGRFLTPGSLEHSIIP